MPTRGAATNAEYARYAHDTSADALTIGGNTIWGEWFAGLLEEVRIYNRALTWAEIQAGMTQTVGGG